MQKPVGEGMWESQDQDGWTKLTEMPGEWEYECGGGKL
jgi:hypothetical protein